MFQSVKHTLVLFALTALLALSTGCGSDTEAIERSGNSSGQLAATQADETTPAVKPAAPAPVERAEDKPAELIQRLSSMPPQQRTVGQDYTLAKLYAGADNSYQAFEALASAVNKGFSDVDRLESDPALTSLHADNKWSQVLMFAQDNKTSGRKITPPQPPGKPRAQVPQQQPTSGVTNVKSPDWTMTDINGDPVKLSDLRGKIVVLDFWATWCGPCKRSMPLIDKYVREQKAEDVVVFSVNVWDRGTDVALNWWNQQNYSMGLLFGNRALTSAYGVQAIPHIVVIDAEGMIRQSQAGYHPNMAGILKNWTDQARKKS